MIKVIINHNYQFKLIIAENVLLNIFFAQKMLFKMRPISKIVRFAIKFQKLFNFPFELF